MDVLYADARGSAVQFVQMFSTSVRFILLESARSINERRDNCLAAEKTAGRVGHRDTTRWDEVAIFRRLLTD